ncbi:MAG: alpha/beta hydrolase [Candidatus Nomurabacteria bacterium]|jgi:predicted alpha/beta hydrolase family esterase|nr:alpha/beta hydrolase [Candidatus Nomurabacteria bacterium]
MKKAILIHGYHSKEVINDPAKPTPSNHQWLPWVSKQLYLNEIFPIAIEMPEPWNPNYKSWKRELERFDIDDGTVLVGHSYGGGFLVHWLSETTKKVGKVILVAPYMGLPSESVRSSQTPEETAEFFDFQIDRDIVKKTKNGIAIFVSKDDNPNILESVKLVNENADNIKTVWFDNKGHFRIKQMGTDHFPELINEILYGKIKEAKC